MKQILYLGLDEGTSRLRARAIGRLGHQCLTVDPYKVILGNKLACAWAYKTGALGFAHAIEGYVEMAIGDRQFDIIIIDNGELISPGLIQNLKRRSPAVVNYNYDNPFTGRDGFRWRLFWKALPQYDLVVTPRSSSLIYAPKFGIKNMIALPMSADEEQHQPYKGSSDALLNFSSEVVFVGTWMPERGPFILRLIEQGVPLRIFGQRWKKAPEYNKLKEHIVDGQLAPSDYVKSISASKIALALLSKGNQDLHTTRTFEIPAIGRLLCGERTSEHLAFFKEGEEAIFWSSADECASQCLELLKDPSRLERIAAAGYARVHANGNFNEPTMAKIIDAVWNLRRTIIQ